MISFVWVLSSLHSLFIRANYIHMFQTIGEKVDVAGVYTHASFIPKKIKWKSKILAVEEITLVTQIKDGEVKRRMYSILSGGNLYRLMFNRETEIWVLEEVWME